MISTDELVRWRDLLQSKTGGVRKARLRDLRTISAINVELQRREAVA